MCGVLVGATGTGLLWMGETEGEEEIRESLKRMGGVGVGWGWGSSGKNSGIRPAWKRCVLGQVILPLC